MVTEFRARVLWEPASSLWFTLVEADFVVFVMHALLLSWNFYSKNVVSFNHIRRDVNPSLAFIQLPIVFEDLVT